MAFLSSINFSIFAILNINRNSLKVERRETRVERAMRRGDELRSNEELGIRN